jgi:LemA protein
LRAKLGCLATAGAALLLVLVPGVWLIASYNKMVGADEQVDAAWAQVQNVLQRRADLIPNLVETVRGYAAHEQGVFLGVSEARARLAGSTSPPDAATADAGLTSALGRLLAISEAYPELKADQNFRQLADELAGTENRIAVERKRYNDLVRDFNVGVQRFPRKLLADFFDFAPRLYFEATPAAQSVPNVDFPTTQP